MSGYESDDESVSDVPYGWSEVQYDEGMILTIPEQHALADSRDHAEARVAPALMSHSRATEDAPMNRSGEPPSKLPRRRRSIWQIPDDSDGEQEPSPFSQDEAPAVNLTPATTTQPQTHILSSTPTLQSQPIRRESHPAVSQGAIGPLERFRLRDVELLEGNITSLPQQLLDALQNWCKRHKTRHLPCAKARWSNGSTVKILPGKGGSDRRGRKWVADSTGEELGVARFRYGWHQQIIVVQAREGSLWEGGAVVVIVNAGQAGPHWKVWRGEQHAEDIPSTRNGVRCRYIPIEGPGAEPGKLAKNKTPGEPNRSGLPRISPRPDVPTAEQEISFRSTLQAIDIIKVMPGYASQRESRPLTNGSLTNLHIVTDGRDTEVEPSLPSGSTIVVTAPRAPKVSDPTKTMITQAADNLQDVDKTPQYGKGADNNMLKRDRSRSESSDSDVPIATQKRKRLQIAALADGRSPGDRIQAVQNDNGVKIGAPRTIMGSNVLWTSPQTTPEHLSSQNVNTAPEPATATPRPSGKPSDIDMHHSRTSKASEPAEGRPGLYDTIALAREIGTVIVSFVDAAREKVLTCFLGELEDTDDLFARARVAGIINKNVRLLEIKCGEENILIQKRFAQDFERLKHKVLKKKPEEILVESGS